jgi:hypothetical protein
MATAFMTISSLIVGSTVRNVFPRYRGKTFRTAEPTHLEPPEVAAHDHVRREGGDQIVVTRRDDRGDVRHRVDRAAEAVRDHARRHAVQQRGEFVAHDDRRGSDVARRGVQREREAEAPPLTLAQLGRRAEIRPRFTQPHACEQRERLAQRKVGEAIDDRHVIVLTRPRTPHHAGAERERGSGSRERRPGFRKVEPPSSSVLA